MPRLAVLQEELMKTWLNPKIEVRSSPIEGKGVFANEPIAMGEQLTRNGHDDYIIMTDEAFQAFTTTASSYDAVALGNGMQAEKTGR
jgi:hypothetical protein